MPDDHVAAQPTLRQRFPREYSSWVAMRYRCTNPEGGNYHRYGGRGITICERWNGFENFLADMGPRPEGKTLDRIDNDGNYEPGNCRWATYSEQTRDRECTLLIEWRGETWLLHDVAIEANIPYAALRARIFVMGWSLEKALATPVRKKEHRLHPFERKNLTLRQISKRTGVAYGTIYGRLKRRVGSPACAGDPASQAVIRARVSRAASGPGRRSCRDP